MLFAFSSTARWSAGSASSSRFCSRRKRPYWYWTSSESGATSIPCLKAASALSAHFLSNQYDSPSRAYARPFHLAVTDHCARAELAAERLGLDRDLEVDVEPRDLARVRKEAHHDASGVGDRGRWSVLVGVLVQLLRLT